MTFNPNWNRTSGAERTEEYRTWRTLLRYGAVCDIDQIEYRFAPDGTIVPVALIELCVADEMGELHPGGVRPGEDPSRNYFAAVDEKVSANRPQGKLLRYVAEKLDVLCLLVVYIDGLLEERGVWVRALEPTNGWNHYSLDDYADRLRQLAPVRELRQRMKQSA